MFRATGLQKYTIMPTDIGGCSFAFLSGLKKFVLPAGTNGEGMTEDPRLGHPPFRNLRLEIPLIAPPLEEGLSFCAR